MHPGRGVLVHVYMVCVASNAEKHRVFVLLLRSCWLPSWRNSLDRCMQFHNGPRPWFIKIRNKIISYKRFFFERVLQWIETVFYAYTTSAAKEHIFVILLTCTALPSHSDQPLISHSYPSPIPWMCLSIAVTVTSVLYFQSRRMNCSGCEAVCRGNSLCQQYHHVVGKLGKYCKVHVFT